jgi:hypothetical protein
MRKVPAGASLVFMYLSIVIRYREKKSLSSTIRLGSFVETRFRIL